MGLSKKVVTFCGEPYTSIASLYSATSAKRDGPDTVFEACSEEICILLRKAGELPADPTRTLRLRRIQSSVNSTVYYELMADLSDNTTTGKMSLKKACRTAFKP